MLYVFGNPALREDAFAIEVASALGIPFRHAHSPDDLLEADGDIEILDVVRGIVDPIIIEDVSRLRTRPMLSLHDFDVGYFLTLMDRLGMLGRIRIIGVPQEGDAHAIARKVSEWIGPVSA